MKRPRILIVWLIAVICVFALFFQTLRSGTEYWYGVVYTTTVSMLTLSVLAARFRRGPSRAFWFGFAVVGWCFFLVGTSSWSSQVAFPDRGLDGIPNRNLMTNHLVAWMVRQFRPKTDDPRFIDQMTVRSTRTCALLLTLILAGAGGGLATIMKRRSRKIPSRPSNPAVLPSLIVLACLALSIPPLLPSWEFANYFPASITGGTAPETFDDEAPPKEFDATKIETFGAEYYSDLLQQMGEPIFGDLSKRDPSTVAFRFLWVPSLDHPIAVRIVRTPTGARLRAVALSNRQTYPYKRGDIAIDHTVELTGDRWRELEAKVAKAGFWEMSVLKPPRPAGDTSGFDGLGEMVMDGDTCVVEGLMPGRHHAVERSNPEAAFEELCGFLLDLAGLKTRQTWEEYHGNPDKPMEPDPA